MRTEANRFLNFVAAPTVALPFACIAHHDTSGRGHEESGGSAMRRGVLAALAILFGTLSASAQDWPTKSVRIIVPFAAGATPDLVARLIADYLQDKLQQTFSVENKPGASGNTGTDAVAKADPDGSTIGVSIGGPLAINTLLFSDLPYDPRKDLALITMLVTQPSALAVNTALSVTAPRELLDLIAHNPGKYAYG